METRQKIIRKIKKLLRLHPNGLTISDLAEKLELNRNSTAKYLEILLISGEVHMNMIGPAKIYTFSQKMPISAILKISADIILLIDNEMRVLDANDNALRLLGISRDMLVGHLIRNVKSPIIAHLPVADVLNRLHEGEIQREFSITHDNDVHHYWVRLIPTVFDTLDEGVTIIGEDITQQKRFEESLRLSEARYRAIVQDQTDMICRWDPEGRITFMNESLRRNVGGRGNDAKNESLFSYLFPEDIPRITGQIAQLTPEQPTISLELRLMDHEGKYRWYQWNTRGIFDNSASLIECQSVGRDINTERQQARKIRESEERFHMITDLSPFPIAILDQAGNFLYINKKFTQLFGYTLDENPTEKDWFRRAFPDTSACEEATDAWRNNCALSAAGQVTSCVFPVICKDGTVRPVNFFQARLQSGEQFVVYEDLTPKKESERLHSILASIVNSSPDAITIFRNLNTPGHNVR